MPMDETNLNWKIRRRLAEREMLQRDLASGIGVSESYISRLMRGTIPQGHDLKRRVAEHLEMEIHEAFPS
jgi:transcriptional regulator with XRE-family HTH domain